VWSLETYELLSTIPAHSGAVLNLFLSEDGNLLFSSAGDAIVNVSDCGSCFPVSLRLANDQ
jgi:di- and tripeptidase